MNKAKIFARNQLLEKSLQGYRPLLKYGERLHMYNHVYKVLNSQDKGYTILEDEKNAKLAFPTNELRMLMKTQICRSVGYLNTLSSNQSSQLVQKAAAPKQPSVKQEAAPSGQPKGQPVGTVTSGSDGENYKKISSNPAVWVKVRTGSVHHEAGGEEQDPMSVSHESRQQFHSMMSHIESKIHPEDRAKVQKKAEEWVKENAKFKHMQAAHNINEVDSSGKKLPRTAVPSATMASIFTQADKARKVRKELIDMIAESHSRTKGTSSAK